VALLWAPSSKPHLDYIPELRFGPCGRPCQRPCMALYVDYAWFKFCFIVQYNGTKVTLCRWGSGRKLLFPCLMSQEQRMLNIFTLGSTIYCK
jgi:hypothetical protein